MQIIPDVAPDERPRVQTAVAAFACVAATGIVARTMGDTLFLTSYPPTLLSSMYVVTALVIALLAYFYPMALARLPLGRLIPLVTVGAVLVALVLRFSIEIPWRPLRIAAYVFGDLMCRIPMLLFWSFAAITFDPRESKRLLGFIGAAGTLASIISGAAVHRVSNSWGPENLLWLIALLLGAFALVIHRAARSSPDRYLTAPSDNRASSSFTARYHAELLGNRQIFDIALLILIGSFSLVMNDFVFKSAARALYSGPALGSFFGTFYTWTSIVALILQLFIVRAVLARGGVSVAMVILPVALLTTAIGVFITAGSSFPWVMAAKAAEMVLEFTINIVAIQMLFLAVKKQSRTQVRSFADGIARPVGIAIAGLLVAFISRTATFPLRVTAAGIILSTIVWLFFARRSYRDYVNGLVQMIDTRRLDITEELHIAGTPAEDFLRRALRTAPPAEIPYLLAIVAEVPDADWSDEIRSLLDRPSSVAKVAALQHLCKRPTGDAEAIECVTRELENEDAEVRQWALRALSLMNREASTPHLHRALRDPDFLVRSVAIAELLKRAEHAPEALASLDGLVASENARARIAAAEAIENAGAPDLHSHVLNLLRDADVEVQTAALRASAVVRAPALLPDIVRLLGEPRAAKTAAIAAAAYGVAAIPHLAALLAEQVTVPAAPSAFRVPVIAQKIGVDALDLLAASLEVQDLRLRVAVVAAYCRIVRMLPIDPYRQTLTGIVEREANATLELAALRPAAQEYEKSELLLRAIAEAEAWHRENVFAALETLYPGVAMESIKFKLMQGASDVRSEAIELLDNVLARSIKSHVLPLFEAKQHAAAVAQRRSIGSMVQDRSSEWVTIGGVLAIGSSKVEGASAMLEKAAEHAWTEVRETALFLMNMPDEGKPRSE